MVRSKKVLSSKILSRISAYSGFMIDAGSEEMPELMIQSLL